MQTALELVRLIKQQQLWLKMIGLGSNIMIVLNAELDLLLSFHFIIVRTCI